MKKKKKNSHGLNTRYLSGVVSQEVSNWCVNFRSLIQKCKKIDMTFRRNCDSCCECMWSVEDPVRRFLLLQLLCDGGRVWEANHLIMHRHFNIHAHTDTDTARYFTVTQTALHRTALSGLKHLTRDPISTHYYTTEGLRFVRLLMLCLTLTKDQFLWSKIE